MTLRVHILLSYLTACALAFADGLPAQSAIPLRPLDSAVARSREPLGLIVSAWRLGDGRVVVNDGGRRRLLLFDSLLTGFAVAADSAGSTGLKYGSSAAPAIAWPHDSTLFLDRGSRAFVVLDPNGKPARVAAPPKAADLIWIGGSRVYADTKGRLVYRGGPVGNPARDTGQVDLLIRLPDSASVVRADFETRQVDTAGRVKLPVLQENHRIKQPNGTTNMIVNLFGLSWADDWTMTADGRVAIVRGRDYHIDWVDTDGARTSSPKMPFDWQRVDDDERRHLADSAAKETQEFIDRTRAAPPPPPRADGSMPPRVAARADLATGSIQVMSIDAVAVAAPLDRIPEYRQPFRPGTTLADRDGNVWILPATSKLSRGGGLVYDVANQSGELVERVELPVGRSIVGFGTGGAVYLGYKEGDIWHIEARRVHR